MQAVAAASGLSTAELIAMCAVGVVVIGWVVGAIGNLLKQDRKTISAKDEELNRQVLALWKNHDDIRRELDSARRDLAVIDDRIQNVIPDQHHWDSKLEAVRSQLERKLDTVLSELKTTQIQLARITPDD